MDALKPASFRARFRFDLRMQLDQCGAQQAIISFQRGDSKVLVFGTSQFGQTSVSDRAS
jgi:hypothetical protein